MSININNYINFDKLFYDIFHEQESMLRRFQHESMVYYSIVIFVDYNRPEYDVYNEKCDFNNHDIIFTFRKLPSRHSITGTEYTTLTITYDRSQHEFTRVETSQIQ